VEEIVYPLVTTPVVAEIDDDDKVNAGAATLTVIEKSRVAVLVTFVAVIVYVLELAATVGVPEMRPVDELKESPGVFEIAGEIE
jgi:hypothetical protein